MYFFTTRELCISSIQWYKKHMKIYCEQNTLYSDAANIALL